MLWSRLRESFQYDGFVSTIWNVLCYVVDSILDLSYKHQPIIDNCIVFSSYPDYSDNARALYEFMVEKGMDDSYELVWVISDFKKYKSLLEQGINCVPRHALLPHNGHHRYYYYGRRTHWYFHTHGHPFQTGGRPNQHMINLWHGGMGFKGGKGIYTNDSTVRRVDEYTLTSGDGAITEKVALAHHHCLSESLLPLGLPRNDLLFKFKYIQKIDSIPYKKILWMPTFRQTASDSISDDTLDSETGFPILYTTQMVGELNEFLEKSMVHIYIKLHPLQIRDKIMKVELSHIHLITNDDLESMNVQLYEILNHFDALLTDYSSVSFDYLYLDRPIGYTLDDFEEYAETRGFPMDNPLDYMPGHYIYTYDDFIGFIADIADGKDEYGLEREKVRKEVGMPEGGKCCQQLLEFLEIV